MAVKTNYLKIGVFTVAALALLSAAVLYFGLSSAFKPVLGCQTYFDHTVQGLSVGSPVNFRGFRVGQVTGIDLPQTTSGSGQLLVRVDFLVFPDALTGSKDVRPEQARNILEREIKNGLRCFLTYQGVSGIGYLDLDYMQASAQDELILTVASPDILVPSARGAMLSIGDSLTAILRSLAQVDFQNLNKSVTSTLNSVERLSAAVEAEVQGLNDTVGSALNDLGKAAADFSALAGKVTADLEGLDLPARSAQLSASLGRLSTVLGQAEAIARATRGSMGSTLENLRVMSENFRELSETARRYPSSIIFGQPPTELPK
ncbi:MAG: MlaD family protein [Deltaproteobacteria bacterium]|jgi:phospholipid/cholesterol/gamma-HCH transport system substrate-binding protein/paraquat-inducible protein B|nr:MlaD family protein [Deltaproteobacteria bacterium]